MGLTGLALTTLLALGTPNVEENVTGQEALDIPSFCHEPDKAFKVCALAPKLYEAAVTWEKRAKELEIDNFKLSQQLEAAEKQLLEARSIPEPSGITLPTWLTIAIPIVAAGAGAGVAITLIR